MNTNIPAEPWHRHDRHCFWDYTRCGWVCQSPAAIPSPREEISAVDLPGRQAEDRGQPRARAAGT